MKAKALSLSAISDNEIIERYMNTQNPALFAELYNRYSKKIYGKCYMLLKDSALAEDAAQDIFTKIFLRLSTFNKEAMFSTWIYAITYNYCIDYIRKGKRSPFVDAGDDAGKHLTDDETDDAAFFEMEINQLQKALDKIPADDRAILLMKYHDDMSIKEICDSLTKSESAIKMKLLRAKQKVREHYLVPAGLVLGGILLWWLLS